MHSPLKGQERPHRHPGWHGTIHSNLVIRPTYCHTKVSLILPPIFYVFSILFVRGSRPTSGLEAFVGGHCTPPRPLTPARWRA